jgi:dynein heavy chain
LNLSDMVEEWLKFQKNWRYLSNILKAPDIKQSLPEETRMFDNVDKAFKLLMIKSGKVQNCMKISKNPPSVLEML